MNQLDIEPLQLNLVVVGDGSVGKTCILVSYTTDKFPKEYIPTVFENYTSHIQVDHRMVNLSLWDTAGQETYSQLRSLSYGQADVFLIVFSVNDQDSFENAIKKWYVELESGDLKNIPKLFVGNKIDLRSDIQSTQFIQEDAAKKIIEQKNCKYMECSALWQKGLKEIFDEAVRLVVQRKKTETGRGLALKDDGIKREKPCCQLM